MLWEKSKISSYSSPSLPGFCVRGNSPEESQTLLTWEIMSFLATMAFVHVLCCMNNTCVRACTHTEKGVIMLTGLRNSTKWKGCLAHNLNTRPPWEALLSSLLAEAPGAQEESLGGATNGEKFPLIKTFSFKDFRATLFICLVFAGLVVCVILFGGG